MVPRIAQVPLFPIALLLLTAYMPKHAPAQQNGHLLTPNGPVFPLGFYALPEEEAALYRKGSLWCTCSPWKCRYTLPTASMKQNVVPVVTLSSSGTSGINPAISSKAAALRSNRSDSVLLPATNKRHAQHRLWGYPLAAIRQDRLSLHSTQYGSQHSGLPDE